MFAEAQGSGKVPERPYIIGDGGAVLVGKRSKGGEKGGEQEDEEKRKTAKEKEKR